MAETKKRKGVNRLLFFAVLIGSYVAFVYFKPFMPHILLPAEPLTEHPLFTFAGQEFHFTNTMTSVLLAYVAILLIAFSIRRQLKAGKMVLDGIAGGIAMILEAFYDMTKSTAGKHARKIFPYFATIFLLVLFVNLQELLPGIDTVGILRPVEPGHHGYTVDSEFLGMGIIQEVEHHEEEGAMGSEHAEAAPAEGEHVEDEHAEGGHEEEHGLYGFFPFLRVASTDLNFTMSLAVVSVVMTQFIGLSVLGREYWIKYFNFQDIGKSWKLPQFGNPLDFILGLVNTVVGFLEIIAEISKVLSFTFRLFGVIFAGSVLLFFMGSMIGSVGQMGVLFLEMLFGPLQAFVFGMLTMVFMSLATHSHAHGDDHH